MFSRIRLLAVLLALLTGLAGPAAAADLVVTAHYTVTLGGTQVATADVGLRNNGSRYALSAAAKVTGFAQLVGSGTARIDSAGQSGPRSLQSDRFELLTRSQSDEFNVNITFDDEDVSSFVVNPPITNEIDRVAIERRQLRGVNDMLAAFVLKGPALDEKLCDRQLHVFTGVERFDLALSYARNEVASSKRTGYQGPVVLCRIRYAPISGHYTSSEMTKYLQQSDRLLVWYAPLTTPGTFIPYRILVATSAGDLSMVLTGLDQ